MDSCLVYLCKVQRFLLVFVSSIKRKAVFSQRIALFKSSMSGPNHIIMRGNARKLGFVHIYFEMVLSLSRKSWQHS